MRAADLRTQIFLAKARLAELEGLLLLEESGLQEEGNMAFSLNNLPSKAEISADLEKVDAVVQLVEKYEGLLPLPSQAKTVISDFEDALKFAESVVDAI